MFSYWIFFSLFLTLVLVIVLCYYNIILKKSKFNKFIRSSTFKSLLKRIGLAFFTLFLIVTVIFLLTEIIPSKYFISTSNKVHGQETNLFIKLLNYYYSLLPFPKKTCATTYINNSEIYCSSYEYRIIDLGFSSTYMMNVSVISILKEKCSISFLFGIIAYALQCLIGYPLGVFMAKHENKLLDKSLNFLYSIIRIVPSVIYFYLFIILFMVIFKFPVFFDLDDPLTYIAPLTALTLSSSLSIAYFVRKYILLEFDKDYVKFARSKGLSENVILFKHVLKNAIIPFIRTIPSSILMCFSGFYLLESSFNIPGIGLTLIYAVQLHDVYLIRGLIIFFSFLSVIAYLIGDILTIIFKRKTDIKEVSE